MEKADEALLPAVYNECYPLAACMAVQYNRAHVIAFGSFLWAAATILVALSDTFLQVAISRASNGVGLALVTPAIQSLVADSTDDSTCGSAFGWLHLTVSMIVGILLRLFAVDPHFLVTAGSRSKPISCKLVWMEVKGLIKEAKAVVKIPSFQLIVAQGVTGSFPCPIFAEIIPKKSRTSIYALSESMLSSFAPPFVGILAEHVYGDGGRVQMDSLKASEMEKIELENFCLVGHHSRIQLSRLELNDKERKVTPKFYEDEDFEIDDDKDDDDERMLLCHQVGISNAR
ncbi:hypothetical protein COCNU_13G003010 [Cocos nucifera]|uniref:Major facilitator superfamily (MFS) profile domain-containing protein n=1 Tax=Cocos nucifera TaxID=13894 RepID=A0A8K0NAN9_COCNU|nr:hypothetical protein COCNU_13G003010 [Cocos nucifera]